MFMNAPESMCINKSPSVFPSPPISIDIDIDFIMFEAPKESINNRSKSSFLFSFTSPERPPVKNVHDTANGITRKELKLIFYFFFGGSSIKYA